MRILNFKNFIKLNEDTIIHKEMLIGDRINEEETKAFDPTFLKDGDLFDFTDLYALIMA